MNVLNYFNIIPSELNILIGEHLDNVHITTFDKIVSFTHENWKKLILNLSKYIDVDKVAMIKWNNINDNLINRYYKSIYLKLNDSLDKAMYQLKSMKNIKRQFSVDIHNISNIELLLFNNLNDWNTYI